MCWTPVSYIQVALSHLYRNTLYDASPLSSYYTWTVPPSLSLSRSAHNPPLSLPPPPFTIPSPFGTLGDRVKATATTS